MLKTANVKAYEELTFDTDLSVNDGVWFLPGNVDHLLSRAVQSATTRFARSAESQPEKLTLIIGAREGDHHQMRETLFEFTFAVPDGNVNGVLNMDVTMFSRTPWKDLDRTLLRSEKIPNLDILEEVLSEVSTAVAATTRA